MKMCVWNGKIVASGGTHDGYRNESLKKVYIVNSEPIDLMKMNPFIVKSYEKLCLYGHIHTYICFAKIIIANAYKNNALF